MKKYYLFIALAMVAAMTVSCKNNNKKAAKTAEANAEVVEAAKTILADDVLAKIDELAQSYIGNDSNSSVNNSIADFYTEEEKLLKPDYLLDPAIANELLSKSQKVSALAILMTERPIRKAFEMPIEETDEVISRLTAELNISTNTEDYKNLSPSEVVKNDYEICKERGDLAYFWHAAFAVQTELRYLIANNPEPFFRNLTEEQYIAFHNRFHTAIKAVETLAEYDADVKEAWDAFNAAAAFDNSEEADKMHATIETAKVDLVARKNVYAARRAALLK